VVAAIRSALGVHGVEVWTDSWQLVGGDGLAAEVEEAIAGARCVVALLSPGAVNSPWVRREIQCALSVAAGRGDGFKVIPLLLPGLEPSALPLWFGEEPVAVQITVGPGGVQAALPDLLAALGLALPVDPAPVAGEAEAGRPIEDLILDLADPEMVETEEAGPEGTPILRRRARAVASLFFVPADGSPRVGSGRFVFTAPLGPIEEEELRWYLEAFPRWPAGVFLERARGIEARLPEWGRRLFAALALAEAREALDAWLKAAGDGGRRFTVEVDPRILPRGGEEKEEEEARRRGAAEAATVLLGLPWELLRDEQGYLFQGRRPARVRRRLPNQRRREPLLTAAPLRVLLVSPRPDDERASYLDHRASALPLVEALGELGDLARLTLLEPPTVAALGRELTRAARAGEPYHAVHFDGHGVYDRRVGLGALCFERPAADGEVVGRKTDLVDAEALAAMIRDHRVPLIFLEACQSATSQEDPTASVAGKLLQGGVASVAAMSHSVLVETARRFVAAFYRRIAAGARIGDAMLAGQEALFRDSFRGRAFTGPLHLQDWFVPVLFQEEGDPRLVHQVPPERVRRVLAETRRLALGQLPEGPEHGFVGRSREMLAAERRLARERYVVFRGQGGEGKTALAVELARWWVASGRGERAAFVSLEQHLDARAVLFALGEQLVPDFLTRAAQEDFELGIARLERALGERPTIVVLDNVESVLPPPSFGVGGGAAGGTGDEAAVLAELLALGQRLARAGSTRLVFTSREALPAPFAGPTVELGRLPRPDAIRLVGRVLGEVAPQPGETGPGETGPGAPGPGKGDTGDSDEAIDALVDAVGCHARGLVLLAREVGREGVATATRRIAELMAGLEAKYPDDRERSLLASVELSLRRLPEGLRERLGPLGVFQGGGFDQAIGIVLGLDRERGEHQQLAQQLAAVGLAEILPRGYLRFDPALAPALLARRLDPPAREAATAAWVEAEAGLTAFLYQQQFKDPAFAAALTLLDLPNLVAAVEHLAEAGEPERLIEVAARLEPLLSAVSRPRALARVERVRVRAAETLAADGGAGGWSHASFLAANAAVDRLLEAGRFPPAVAAARENLRRAREGGEGAYAEAAYDRAMCHWKLGRALKMSGDPAAALGEILAARQGFETLAGAGNASAARMASACLTEAGDCLRDLGRLDEAALAYEENIRRAEALDDPRQAATGKGQLGTVRLLQGRHADALAACTAARETFEALGEPGTVATAWHQIGIVHEKAGQPEAAEEAYREALKIKVQRGDPGGQASTLLQLGNLYAGQGRLEEAVRFYRQAAAIYTESGDLAQEGRARGNLGDSLLKLGRRAEARQELLRAVECKQPFGHAAEPWKTFNLLTRLEGAEGNPEAAAGWRRQAIDAYLAYRRAGGYSPVGGLTVRLCTAVAQAIATGATAQVRAELDQLASRPDLPTYLRLILPALRTILAGSRDPALAEAPELYYRDAVELTLLLEHLAGAS